MNIIETGGGTAWQGRLDEADAYFLITRYDDWRVAPTTDDMLSAPIRIAVYGLRDRHVEPRAEITLCGRKAFADWAKRHEGKSLVELPIVRLVEHVATSFCLQQTQGGK